MKLLIGQRLHQGKYILDQELGRGGFGITYRAINTPLNQVVVIKTLNDGLREDPGFLNHQYQFQAEARRLAKCLHPGIVRVIDFFVEADLPFIVMDYVPGQTLDTVVLPDKPLPEAMALDYIRQVGAAVKAVHHNGLLHRDIKPPNLIRREGTQQIVLIDFGIAREFTPGLTQTHTHLVSEGYAPIEQYLPQAQRSPATDVYGIAATLYTLLTATIPVASILRDRQPLPAPCDLRPELSAAISQAVMWGMAIEVRDRPASVDEWLRLLPGGATGTVPIAGLTHPSLTLPVGHGSAAPSEAKSAMLPSPSHPIWQTWVAVGSVTLAAAAIVGAILARPQPSPLPRSETTASPESSPVPLTTPAPVRSPAMVRQPTTAEPSPPPASPSPSPSPSPASSPSPSPSPEVVEPPPPSDHPIPTGDASTPLDTKDAETLQEGGKQGAEQPHEGQQSGSQPETEKALKEREKDGAKGND